MDEPTQILTDSESQRIYAKTVPPSPVHPFSASQLKGDLDNIVLMALRKEADRRYVSVEDLSKDISNYLNGLPVNARPNTFFYRLSKFYTRNKTASIIGLFLALSLIVGIIATTWQAVAASQARDRAEKRFQDVRHLSNSLLFEITPKIERLQGSTEAREVVVKRALEYLDSLSNESHDDLSLQSELASAYEKVGEVQGNPNKANLGDLEGGMQSLEKANKIRLALVDKNPDDVETQRLLAANYNLSGDFRWWASDVEGSAVVYDKAISILEKLAAQNPDDLQINLNLLNSTKNKIRVISYNGNYDESIKQYQQMMQKVEELEKRFPANAEFQRLKGHILIRTAYDLSWQNRYDILDDYVKKSLAIFESLIGANPNDAGLQRDLHYIYFQAGAIYIEDDPPLSRKYLEKSAEIAKRTTENDPVNYQAKHDLAQSYSKLGEVLRIENKYDEAIEYLHKAGTILAEISAAEPKHEGYKYGLANNYARLAAAQEGKGDFQAAIQNYQKTIEEHSTMYQTDPNNNMSIREIAVAAQDLAKVYEKKAQLDKALISYQKSVEMFVLLERKKALGDYDRQHFEVSQKAVERLQKK